MAYMKARGVATVIGAGNVPTRSNLCAGDWGSALIQWRPHFQIVVRGGMVSGGRWLGH